MNKTKLSSFKFGKREYFGLKFANCRNYKGSLECLIINYTILIQI